MSKKVKTSQEGGFESVEHALSNVEQFVEKYQKTLTITIIVILCLVAVFLGAKKYYVMPKEKEAQEEMFVAEKYFELDSFRLALDGDGGSAGLLDIIDDYGLTKSANLAKYYAGICYLQLGEFEDAIDYLKKFNGKDRLVATIALGAIGDAYIELDDMEKGLDYYIKASEREPNNLTSPIYLKKAAQVYEKLEEYEKALKLFNKIKYDFPLSEEAKDIDKYIARASVKASK